MNTNLETIDGFESRNEFLRFQTWINQQIDDGSVAEINVDDYYAGVNFEERWFEFKSIGQVWRLVYPDGLFKGYWGQVFLDKLTRQ